MYHETEKNVSFQKILIRTNFSGENAYARDKTFHVRDLAVPRVEQGTRKACRPPQPFSCASFRARHARGFPIYLELLRDPRGQFLLTYVSVN